MSEKIILEFKNKQSFLHWFSFSQYEEVLYEIYYKKLEEDYAESQDKDYFSQWLKDRIIFMSAHPSHSSSPGVRICEEMELKAAAKFYEKIRYC